MLETGYKYAYATKPRPFLQNEPNFTLLPWGMRARRRLSQRVREQATPAVARPRGGPGAQRRPAP